MYVCVYVCICIYVCECMYVCMCVCVYVDWVDNQQYGETGTIPEVCMYVCMCVCVYMYLCM